MSTFDYSSFPVLETERLRLRDFRDDDALHLLQLRSDPEVMRYLDREPFRDLSEAEAMVARIRENFAAKSGVNWMMELHDGTFVGNICIWRIDAEHFRGELGYMLLPEHWQKGYTKEALQAVIAFAFGPLELHSLEANINPGNTASRQLLISCGFQQEAYFRENYYFRGQFLDGMIFSLINANDPRGKVVS